MGMKQVGLQFLVQRLTKKSWNNLEVSFLHDLTSMVEDKGPVLKWQAESKKGERGGQIAARVVWTVR